MTTILLSPEYIVTECCRLFGIQEVEIKTTNRLQERVVCRVFIAHFLSNKSNLSTVRIGKYIGRDHSNVIHLLRTINVYKKMDPLYHAFFNSLYEKFHREKPINICPTCGAHRQ